MTPDFELAKNLFIDGVRDFEAGRFAIAEQKFRASLVALPGRASTLCNLGATLNRLGRPGEALAVLDQAVAAEPGNLDAWCHRGAALGALGRHEEALACYDKALAADPRRGEAWYQHGLAANLLQRHDAALHSFDQVLRLEPARGDAWVRHGQTLQHLERPEEALASYDRALAIDPALIQAWTNKALLLKDLQRLDEAAEAFESAIARGADPEVNGYFLASIGGQRVPARPPREFVETLFDDYADQFNQHLVEVLKYRAPELIAETLVALEAGPFRSVLDLGCGTGLCGPLLKPVAAQIIGVDLSRNMLDRAAALGVYDQLVQGDIVDHLNATGQRHDLVVSADVFIYVGDLAAAFGGVARVLDPGGLFCFSIELADEETGFTLRPSLRYAHSEGYVRELAAQHGFETLTLLRQPVREDKQQPIPGLYAFLRKRRIL